MTATPPVTKAKNAADFLKICEAHNIEYVKFTFTDLRSKRQSTYQHISTLDKDMVEQGIYFDGSSILGWKAINESDMNLVPDLNKICIDPFAAQPTLQVFCDVFDPITNEPYGRDPRSIGKKAEAYLKSTGIADTASFGPEAEFFVFDDVRYSTSQNKMAYEIDGEEGPYNTDTMYDGGNMGHRPGPKGG
ncbi:MAG: glutamine synthetase beta-grasp domain-containing protein, partial [Pseudobdellovibrionaceae bacterium]